jgi:1-acyl-sn-glycerol-3-phosphate acyltransferase
MDHRLFQVPVLHTISKIGKAIPIATHKEDPEMKAAAFKAADKVLKGGGVIGIFPEGSITRDGKIALFKKGLEQIIESAPAPVVPMALEGMWGSFFSRKYNGRAMSVFPKRFWSKIRLNIGKPIPPEEFSIERLQEEIQRLHDEAEEKS